jgi:hypothetical protein
MTTNELRRAGVLAHDQAAELKSRVSALIRIFRRPSQPEPKLVGRGSCRALIEVLKQRREKLGISGSFAPPAENLRENGRLFSIVIWINR